MRSASEQPVRGRLTVVQCIENATRCDEMAAATDHPDNRDAFDNAAISWRDLARLMMSIEQTMERAADSSLRSDGSSKSGLATREWPRGALTDLRGLTTPSFDGYGGRRGPPISKTGRRQFGSRLSDRS